MSHLTLPPLHPINTPRSLTESSKIEHEQKPIHFISIQLEDVSPTLASVPAAANEGDALTPTSTPMTGTRKSYEEIKETLQPFDLVFFKGADFVSKSIRHLQKFNHTSGEFSHVGMVISSDILPCIKNSRPGQWFIWESTMSGDFNDGIPDAETGEGYFGTQFRSLDTVIDIYSKNPATEVAFAPLLDNPIHRKVDESADVYSFRIQHLQKQLRDTYEQFNHRTYDASLVNLIATIVPMCRCLRNCRRNESFFCSELVSIIYKKIGVFPWYLNEEDITPETLLSRRFIVKNYIRNEAKNQYLTAELPAILQYPPIYITK